MTIENGHHIVWGHSFRYASTVLILSGLLVFTGLGISKSYALNSTGSVGISPALIFTKVYAGTSSLGSIQISNSGDSARTVNLVVKQFGVNAYTYTYNFQNDKENWISLSKNSVSVQPHQSSIIDYTINVPKGNAPGGNYFTIIASSAYNTGAISGVGQAASLMYVTVNGKLDYSSHIINDSVGHFVFGPSVNYKFTIVATGNVYQYVNVFGQLHGLTAGVASEPTPHIIYPGAPRKVTGQINHPILPGIYSVSYGYTTSGGQSVHKDSWVLYIPPWFIALILVVVIVFLSYRSKRKKAEPKEKTNHSKVQQ